MDDLFLSEMFLSSEQSTPANFNASNADNRAFCVKDNMTLSNLIKRFGNIDGNNESGGFIDTRVPFSESVSSTDGATGQF